MFGEMFRGANFFDIFLCNIVLAAVWCVSAFIACVKLPTSFFSFEKKRYLPKKWERNGRWYKDHLRIHKWKDRLPQHIAKDGFSKSHLTNVSIEYLDEFIMETCRGEWLHLTDCLLVVVLLLINPFPIGLLFAFLDCIGNLPFAIIQRYNRFRLLQLRKKVLHDMQHRVNSQEIVPAAI